MATERAPIAGTVACGVCGARVAVRLSAKGRGWWHCHGELDERACDSRLTMGERPSRQLAGTRTPAPEPATDGQPAPAQPAGDGGPWGRLGIQFPGS